MLESPLIWWTCLTVGAALIAAGAAAAALGLWKALRRRPGRAGLWLGPAMLLAGVSALAALHAYGPWWRHASTRALIRALPAHAPDRDMADDPVAAELRQRIIDWAVPKPDRVRLAALCAELIRDRRYPWQLGAKAAEIMVWMKEEKYAHTDDILAGLERDDPVRAALLERMHKISDMSPRIRRAMMVIVADGAAAPSDRCAAAWTLAIMGPDAREAVPSLVAALSGPDVEAPPPSVVRSAALALGRIGPAAAAPHPEALARLEAIAASESAAFATRYTARVAAACLRGEIPGEAHAHAAELRNNDPRTRRRAALGLRWLANMREAGVAVRELLDAMGDPDEMVARLARETLVDLIVRDERYGQMLEELAPAAPEAEAQRIRTVLADVDRTLADLRQRQPTHVQQVGTP